MRRLLLGVLLLCVLAPAMAQWARQAIDGEQFCVRETGERFDTQYNSPSWATAVCRTLNRVESLIGASIPKAQAQLLLTNPGVDPATGDAGGESGGGSESGPLADSLTDDFDDDSTDTTKWDVTAIDHNASVTVSESGGRVTITPLTSTAGNNYNGYASDDPHNLTDSSIAVQVVQATTNFGDTELIASLDADNYFAIVKDGTQLYFKSRVEASNSSEFVSYDEQTHRCWRIRHQSSDDTINWETSADCSGTWTTQRTAGRPFAVTALTIGIRGGTSVSEATPGTAVFDNFNLSLSADALDPSVPTDLAATAASDTEINLSWTASTDTDSQSQVVSGLDHYNVYRTGTGLIDTTTSALYTDTGLTESTLYEYQVSAVDVAGNESDLSTADSATTEASGGGGGGGSFSVSGTATHDGSFTITGSGFGDTGLEETSLFDDAEYYTGFSDGDIVPYEQGPWCCNGGNQAEPRLDTSPDSRTSRSPIYYRTEPAANDGGTLAGTLQSKPTYTGPRPDAQFHAVWWVHSTQNLDNVAGSNKVLRLRADGSGTGFRLSWERLGVSLSNEDQTGATNTQFGGGLTGFEANEWNRLELWIDWARDSMYAQVDGVSAVNQVGDLEGYMPGDSPPIELWPLMIGWDPNNNDAKPLPVAWDDIAISPSRASVWLSTSSTWTGAAADREYQPVTAWTAGQIQGTYNLGGLPASGDLYMYVREEDGSVNSAGVQVR